MAVVRSESVINALIAAGVLHAGDRITRVVIDLQVNYVPVIHVQRLGDERLLEVIGSMVGVEIRDGDRTSPAGREP